MCASVLVINPWVHDFKLYDEWMHPVGLYVLMALLKARGADVHFFNCLSRDVASRAKRHGTGEFDATEIHKPPIYHAIKRKYKRYGCGRHELLTFLEGVAKPNVICIGSMMTYWAGGVVETVSVVRSVYRDTPIVVGGVAAHLIPQYFETQLGPNCSIAGPIFTSGFVSGFPHDLPPPFPLSGASVTELSIVDALKIVAPHFHGPVLSTFGCPMRCSYCASHALSPPYIARPVEIVSSEVRFMVDQLGMQDFAFYDDALLHNSAGHFVPLMQSLRNCGSTLRFHTPNGLHVKYLDKPVLVTMKESGFATLRFGYESGAREFRADTGAKAQWSDLEKAVDQAVAAGFSEHQIGVYIMAGLYKQKPTDVIEELKRVSSLGVQVKPVFLSPVPQTKLFETYAAQFPELRCDPLSHNDTFFITQLEHWNESSVEEIRSSARELNKRGN